MPLVDETAKVMVLVVLVLLMPRDPVERIPPCPTFNPPPTVRLLATVALVWTERVPASREWARRELVSRPGILKVWRVALFAVTKTFPDTARLLMPVTVVVAMTIGLVELATSIINMIFDWSRVR